MYKNEVLSIVFGYVSIASWIVVLLPQIWTNFKLKSSDSLSLTFLYIWAAGDLLNLTGAILQNLLKTMILLAVYYIFTDIVVISQVYYYRRRSVDEIVYSTVEETTPLISDNNSNNSTPESRRQARIKQFLYIFSSLIGVCLTGVISYVISSDKSHEAVNLRALNESDEEMKLLPQIFGWASAILYLGSRIPQILQNYKNKTTEGLALAMFCFSVLGNISYSLSIIFHSTDPKYLLVNLAWLVGSGGTLVFDFVIFAQFYIYRNNSYIKPNSTTHNQTTGNV